jgi:hypothetical protein
MISSYEASKTAFALAFAALVAITLAWLDGIPFSVSSCEIPS